MAIVELKIPSPGESITEVVIARWVKNSGDVVEKDEDTDTGSDDDDNQEE